MKKNLKIYLASPRGFCAGVKRAIEIVEKSIQKYGAPVYVRHEIVHNKQVVEDLKKKGAVFVEVYDISGKKLQASNDKEQDISALSPGVYFVKVNRLDTANHQLIKILKK